MKKKLIASVFSLAMAFILMTSASFAWFTVSTAPEIKDVQVTMEATKNLEIAEAKDLNGTQPDEVSANDANNEQAWGAVVTFGSATNLNFPAVVTSSNLKTIDYAADGRTAGLTATVSSPSSLSGGVGNYTASVKMPDGSNVDKQIATVYCCWLRSNQSLTDVKMEVTPDTSNSQKFKVAYDIGSGFVEVPSGNVVENIGLTADTAKFVKILVYVDGTSVVAADVDTAITAKYNIKFTSQQVLAN